jgi:hypothetical protein
MPENYPEPSLHCSKGHRIYVDDVRDAMGKLLPCGCPTASKEGRRAEGLPATGELFQVPIEPRPKG